MNHQLYRTRRQHGLPVSIALLLIVTALFFAAMQALPALGAATSSPAHSLKQVWDRAKASGAYHFSADIVQTTTPLATVDNVGRQSKQDTLHVEGRTNLLERKLEMTLWSQGGSVVDASSGVQVRVEGERAFVRQGDQAWQPVDSFTGLFAPESDFMTYLVAVKDVVDYGVEKRSGFNFNRYGFAINGPGYAAYVRDQMEEQLARKGELPPGMQLDLPQQYAQMTGQGELWVDAAGLPLRQVLRLQMPDQKSEQISAEVTVDFTQFGQGVVQTAAVVSGSSLGINLASLLAVVAVLALIWLLMARSRSRTVYTALALAVIVSMVFSPILQGAQVFAFSERQAERAKQRDERQQESEMLRAVKSLENNQPHVPDGALDLIQNDNGADADRDGLTDVQERLLGTNPLDLTAAAGRTAALAVALPANNGTDTDGDGLTDYTEALLGTLPDFPDSDGDTVTDTLEVQGFSYTGSNRTWYGDPLQIDTNRDGVGDQLEWQRDENHDGKPDDSDNDGVPDLFDNDNDGDDVPDDLDISPNTNYTTVYSVTSPLELTLDNLQVGNLSYVEFQLRPTNPNHLWYAFNVLDWPGGDRQGTMQDDDNATFADVNPALPSSPNANGDIQLVPMLELRIPGSNAHLPDTATLDSYGIAVQPLPDGQQAVYVPLQLTADPKGGNHVAFYGKMLYLPEMPEWGDAHQARLVWVVQALADICAEFTDGQCSSYTSRNEVQVIHTYDDSFHLTGLNVRENHDTHIALMYEDPAVDTNLNEDTPLWELTHGLEASFLSGRTAIGSGGIPVRDVTIDNLYTRFNHDTNGAVDAEQRWNISNTLNVETATYTHLDAALMTTAMTETKHVLNTAFTPHWSAANPITPTVLFAREDHYRNFNLDEQVGENADLIISQGQQLTFNLQPDAIKIKTLVSVNWAPYRYDGSQWSSYPVEEYWNELERRYAAEYALAFPDAEVAGGALGLAQTYYVAFYRGIVNVVQTGDLVLQQQYYSTDKPLAAKFAGAGQSGTMFVTRILAANVLNQTEMFKWYDWILRNQNTKTYRVGNPLTTLGEGLSALYQKFLTWWRTGQSFRFGLAMAATVAVVAAVAVGTYYLVQAYISDSPGARIAVAVVVGAITAYMGIVAPIIAAVQIAKSVQSAGVTGLAALRQIQTIFSETSRAARIAGVVGLVIAIGITWGIFIYAVTSSNIAPGSVAFNMLLAQAIAATIVAILMFVVSLSIVGAIIVAIISVIDLILALLGEDFTISGWVTDAIAKHLYHFQLTVDTDVQTGAFDMNLLDPSRGLAAGNTAQVFLPITTTLVHSDPEGRLIGYLDDFFDSSTLRSTSFKYALNEGPGSLDADRNEMRSAWDITPDRSINLGAGRSHTLYRGTNLVSPTVNMTLSAGVNISLPVHLLSGYALPGVECWTIVFGIPVCYDKTLEDSHDMVVGAALVLDVLPATLDEFYAFDWGGPMPFGPQKDHDGDGLIAREQGGNDLDDSFNQCNGGVCWDTDSDGLSDRYELEVRALGVENGGSRISPLANDTDVDGLCDADEMRLGTDPGKRDTDGDGLTDGAEVWHQDRCDNNGNGDTGEWLGGWDFTAIYTSTQNVSSTLTVRINSNPLLADEDQDSLNDLAEKTLNQLDPLNYPFNPHVFNESPIALYVSVSDGDRIVRPGQTFLVTTTVQNNLSTPLYALGNVTVTLPTALGGRVLTDTYDLFPAQARSVVTSVTASASSSLSATVGGAYFARLHNGQTTPTWSWDPPRLSQDTNLTNVYPRQVALTALYGATNDYALASLEGTTTTNFITAPLFYAGAQGRQAVSTIGGPIALNLAASGVTGDTAPDIASNNSGVSLAVWPNAHWYTCKQVYLDHIYVTTQGDQSGGSEYYIVRTNQTNSRDWNRSFSDAFGTRIFTDTASRSDGATVPINITTTLCEGDSIAVWEDDGTDAKADDFVCSFSPIPYPPTNSALWDVSCSDGGDTNLTVFFRLNHDTNGDWLGKDNLNCSQVYLDHLDVINSDDHDTASEYYINLNGHHRYWQQPSIAPTNNAAGTSIWATPVSLDDDMTQTIGVMVPMVCRGDTLDVWEDDGTGSSAPDDYICSLAMLDDTPASTLAEIDRSVALTCNGNPANGDHDQLKVWLRVVPNPKYTIGGSILNANGTVVRDVGVQGFISNTVPVSNPTTYRRLLNPAVASDGTNFLVGSQDISGTLRFRTVGNTGGLGAPQTRGTSSAPLSHVDLSWAGTRYIAVWENRTQASNGNIEMAYIGQNGLLESTVAVANSSLDEFQPSVAYDPAQDKALVVYTVRIDSATYSVRGRFVQGSSVSEEFVIGSLPTQASPPFFFTPGNAVAFDRVNNTWLVAWNFFNFSPFRDEIHYRALAADGTPLLPEEAVAISSGMNREHLSLACSDPNAVAPNCAFVTHSDPNASQQKLKLDRLFLRSIPPWLGEISGAAGASLIVDADTPTSTLGALVNHQTIHVAGTLIIGGNANDATSNIASVEVSLDNGTTWQPATGKESWAFAWTPGGSGDYTIRTRATDIAGNQETPSAGITVHVDNAAPQITSNNTGNPILGATRDAQNHWHVVLSGTATDSAGVASVEGLVTPNGNGWQAATRNGTLNSSDWALDYVLPLSDADGNALINATGQYTLAVLATDAVSNETPVGDFLTIPFRVDTTPPVADLRTIGPSTTTPSPTAITQTVTLSGVITDPGSVASGIQGLQIDFVPAGQTTNAWNAATLTSSGAGIVTSDWAYPVPVGLENNYLINLRGTDVLSNSNNITGTWFGGWQGEIDTLAPRAVVTVTYEGAGSAATTHINAWTQDLNLIEDGLEFPCSIQQTDRRYYSAPWWDEISNHTQRLYELHLDCLVNEVLITPPTLHVFDLYGHETVVTATLPANVPPAPTPGSQSSMTTQALSADAPQAGALPADAGAALLAAKSETMQAPDGLVTPQAVDPNAPTIASTVLTPTHESALSTLDPVSVTGGAYAINYLKSLTLTVNGNVIYTTNWAANTVTDTLWSTTWTPAAEGAFGLVSVAEDWNGALQTQLQPISVTVDTQAPSINFDSTVLTTTRKISFGRVELTGAVSDTIGLENVAILLDGNPLGKAAFDTASWRYLWNLGLDPDGQVYMVTAQASDTVRTTSTTEAVTIDIVPPSEVTATLAYTSPANTYNAVTPGVTVRDGSILSIDWTASSDGSGLSGYYAGWTNNLTPTLAALTAYAPNAARHHEAALGEATAWLAHVVTLDAYSNPTARTLGPIYVDAPTTPDYINPEDGVGPIYRGWMDSGCSQIGADHELARNAASQAALADVQRLYLTWDASALRIAWTGADWDVDGDLFIYFDTQSGGATTAYNPYASPMTINLPNQLGADYVVHIEDAATAQLLQWNGTTWVNDRTLTAPNYLLDTDRHPATTDLHVPFNWLGSPSSLKLVALASEENALRLWAAMPDKNPLNSQRAVSSVAVPYLTRAFTLTQQYEWSSVGAAGVCPSASQFEDADLHVTLTSNPNGVEVGYLEHDLPGLTPPDSQLDGNLDGLTDQANLPLDTNPAPIGQGQTVSYTLRIVNDGAATASGVVVSLTARGGLQLLGNSNAINVGTLAAGTSTTLTFSANVNTALDGESGEIDALVADAVHGPFGWLWVQHDIDTVGPQPVNIVSPLAYIGPYTNTLRGVVSDRSHVPTIALDVQGGSTQSCTDATPDNGEWVCAWNAGGAADGTVFQLRARGTDRWGNTGPHGDWQSFTVDAVPPAITLSAATQSALADNRLIPDELGMRGQVSDDKGVAQAEVCGRVGSSAVSTCVLADVASSVPTTSADWFTPAPLDSSLDGVSVTLTFVGIDIAGNRSPTLTHAATVDLQAPQVTLSNVVPLIGQYTTVTALSGTARDGSGIASLNLQVTRPDTSFVIVPAARSGNSWSYTAAFIQEGVYHVGIRAVDTFGNQQVLGTYDLHVLASGVNVPPTVGLSPGYVVDEGSSIVINSNASDINLDLLTYAWDLDNDGQFDDATTAMVTFSAASLDGPSSYPISVQVTDGRSDPVVDSTIVTVNNVAPYDIGLNFSAITIDENEAVSLSGSFADSGVLDTHTVVIDWGDGGTDTLNLGANVLTFGPVTHTYLDDDPSNTPADDYPVIITVTDDDADADSASATVTVNNVTPTLLNVAANTINENSSTTLTGQINDPGAQDSFTLLVDWGDGSDPETFNYAAGTTAFSLSYQYLDDNPTGTPSDVYTIQLTVADDDSGQTPLSTTVTVNNVPPTFLNVAATNVNENSFSTLTGQIGDPGTQDSFTLLVNWGDGSAPETFSYLAGTTAFTETHLYLDDNPSGTPLDIYTISLTVTDDDSDSSTVNRPVTVTNVPPVVQTSLASQTLQYSDYISTITITGTDILSDLLTISTSWRLNSGATVTPGLPLSLTLANEGCLPIGNQMHACHWALAGIANIAAGVYTVTSTVADDDTGQTSANTALMLNAEDALVSFDAGNVVAVKVTSPGSNASLPFSLTLRIQEAPESGPSVAPGNINLAQVSVTLEPVGPGSTVTVQCTSTGPVTPFDYSAVLTVRCNFSGVPVNTYTVKATVVGGYYTSYGEDVLVVYDPSLGFTTGGGWFNWPGTTDRTNFGYTMKYNKQATNIQGSLLLVRHVPNSSLIYRVKSNSLFGLSLGQTSLPMGWASFSGKATYQEPGWPLPIGNYEFTAYVEDRNEPGSGIDRFWIEVRDKDGRVVTVMSVPRPGSSNGVPLQGGNIVVPHGSR